MPKAKDEVQDEVQGEVETDQVLDAFNDAIEQGLPEDEVKLKMISAGATFKNVARLFNKYSIDAGLTISAADRKTAVANCLSDMVFDTEESFEAAVAAVVESVANTNEKSAASLVRAFAKKAELDCFKKAKGTGTGSGRSGFASGFYRYLIANPSCTKEEATAYVMGTDGCAETSANTQRHLSHYLSIWNMVDTIRKG